MSPTVIVYLPMCLVDALCCLLVVLLASGGSWTRFDDVHGQAAITHGLLAGGLAFQICD